MRKSVLFVCLGNICRSPLAEAAFRAEAARLGLDAGLSWSCYDPVPVSGGEALHCGFCDSCRLRSKGFEEAGLADPTAYAARP